VIGGGVTGLDISGNSVTGGPRSVRIGDFGGGSANSNVTVTCNSLTGASTAGLEIATGTYTGTLSGTLNWWGSATGPTIATNPGGTGSNLVDPDSAVSFTPFLIDGTDSDPLTPGFQCVPKASVADVTGAEGNAGTSTLDFTVALNNPSGSPVTVDYATADGTAAGGADYQGTSGTLTYAPGELSKTISVPVIGDTADELDETFKVTLLNPSGATIADGDAVGTIADDDVAGLPPDTRAPLLRILAGKAPKLGRALKNGLGVRLSTDEAGAASVVARVSGRTARGLKVVGSAKVVVVARGKRALQVGTQRIGAKFTRKAKKKFKRVRKLKLQIVAKITDAAGNAAVKRRKLTLKR
jgi:hypothetical protein